LFPAKAKSDLVIRRGALDPRSMPPTRGPDASGGFGGPRGGTNSPSGPPPGDLAAGGLVRRVADLKARAQAADS